MTNRTVVPQLGVRKWRPIKKKQKTIHIYTYNPVFLRYKQKEDVSGCKTMQIINARSGFLHFFSPRPSRWLNQVNNGVGNMAIYAHCSFIFGRSAILSILVQTEKFGNPLTLETGCLERPQWKYKTITSCLCLSLAKNEIHWLLRLINVFNLE